MMEKQEFDDVMAQLSILAPGEDEQAQPAAHALAQFKKRANTATQPEPQWRFIHMLNALRKRKATFATALAVLLFAVSFMFPAVRAAASDILGIFRVERFAAISISPEQLAMLETIAETGVTPGELVMHDEPADPVWVDSVETADAMTDYDVRTVTALGEPSEVNVADDASGTLIVDLAASRSILEAAGLDPMLLPDDLDGAEVDVTVYPIVAQMWGEDKSLVQAPSPLVEYPDSVDETAIAQALLQILGLDEAEAASLAASIDWTSTMLVPFPSTAVTVSEVTVEGGSGLMMSEIGGSGNMIVWENGGILYAFGGDATADELLALIDSMD